MKKLMSLLVLSLVPVVVLAQDDEEETLFDGDMRSGGFGGPVVKFTQINNEFGMLVGGRGGWVINNTLVIGGGGYSLSNDIAKPTIEMHYSGFEIEYIAASNKAVHFSIQALIGDGEVEVNDDNKSKDRFFIAEPGINLMLNMTYYFRIGFGASYRYIDGVNLQSISNNDLNGFSANVTFKFGDF